MSRQAAASAFDLDGAFNDLTLRLLPGADAAPVIAAIDELLDPYGGTGAYDRGRQVSHSFLNQELEQLQALAWIMPPIFFVGLGLPRQHGARALDRAGAPADRPDEGGRAIRTFEIAVHYLKLAGLVRRDGDRDRLGCGHVCRRRDDRTLTGSIFQFPLSGQFAVHRCIRHFRHTRHDDGLLLRAPFSRRARHGPTASRRRHVPPAPPKFTQGVVDRIGPRNAPAPDHDDDPALHHALAGTGGGHAVGTWAASVAVLIGSFFFFDAVEVMMDEMFSLSIASRVTLSLSREQTLAAIDNAR